MNRNFSFALLALFFIATTPASALTAADRAWIATCVDQLRREHTNKTIVRRYCTCMRDYFEGNAKVPQREMEHLFPPAHRLCRKQAGWK